MTDALLDLLFPPKCPFCGGVQDALRICPDCEKSLPWTEEAHGLRELRGGLLCAAPLWYEGSVREAVHRFKFHGGVTAAGPLGELMAQTAAERFSGEFDTVSWVPVSAKRLRKRGYDQAELLARSACRRWDVKPVRLLEKIRDNPAQSGMTDAAARRANVEGVYRAAEPESIQGRRILLVDDICTTGATLVECAGILRSAGAAEVVCAVVARTPLEGS